MFKGKKGVTHSKGPEKLLKFDQEVNFDKILSSNLSKTQK